MKDKKEKNVNPFSEMTIKVSADFDMNVSNATMEKCIKILNWWLKENPDKRIVGGGRKPNGKVEKLRIITVREVNDA